MGQGRTKLGFASGRSGSFFLRNRKNGFWSSDGQTKVWSNSFTHLSWETLGILLPLPYRPQMAVAGLPGQCGPGIFQPTGHILPHLLGKAVGVDDPRYHFCRYLLANGPCAACRDSRTLTEWSCVFIVEGTIPWKKQCGTGTLSCRRSQVGTWAMGLNWSYWGFLYRAATSWGGFRWTLTKQKKYPDQQTWAGICRYTLAFVHTL